MKRLLILLAGVSLTCSAQYYTPPSYSTPSLSWESSPLNYQNSEMNFQNSPLNFDNSPLNYQNSPLNPTSNNGVYDNNGNRTGYGVTNTEGVINLFDNSGNRQGYIPQLK